MAQRIIFTCILITTLQLSAQTTLLKADGPGNTYQLINSKFAPTVGSAIESPGFKTNNYNNHYSFINHEGNNNHISEILDPQMGAVFQFSIHAKEDKDRYKCSNNDRQRNEIKTYASSPDYLKGTIGENVEYKWTMKLPNDFMASQNFTHLHQIKSVGGIKAEEKMPLITITAYKKTNGDELHIRHSENSTQKTIAKVPLKTIKGEWVEFTEKINYKKGKNGTYQLSIKNINSDKVILNYKDKLLTYKKNEDLQNIKDENILFGYFKITEL